MNRRVRLAAKIMLVIAAAVSTGCAQLSETPGTGNTLGADNWPTPNMSHTPAPVPPEPTNLPQAVMPPLPTETQLNADLAKRATAPVRRAGATTSAAPSAQRAAPVKPSTAANESRDVWQRIRNGFQMEAFDHSLVNDWENYYASRAEYFGRMIDNASHFLFHIVNQVEQRKMPLEIALLPMIESAYNPVAYSHAHASGIWQFIPSTGKNYGLKQNWWYDGRRDVIAATGAALDYLQTLYGMFNDWELALAAYNWGEGAVQRAIDRNKARGLPTDYRSLENMPAETRNYLPKLIAVKNLIANPARFGLTLAHVPNEPYFEVLTVRRHIDVARAAQFAGMSMDEFRFLNPAHNKRVINSNVAETIVIPKNRVAQFTANMAKHDDKPLVSTRTHIVRAGERPDTIAAQYGIAVEELNQLNNLGGRRHVATGQTLIVPNNELQPTLEDNPVFAPVMQSVATRTVMQKTVVVRNGVRRTVMVPVQVRVAPAATAARSGPMPLHAAVRRNAGRQAAAVKQPAVANKPGMQRIVYQPAAAPTKAKRR